MVQGRGPGEFVWPQSKTLGNYGLLADIRCFQGSGLHFLDLGGYRQQIWLQLRQQGDMALEQLRRQGERETELLKQQLDIQNEKEKLRFAKITEKQAALLSIVYSKLVRAHSEARAPNFRLYAKLGVSEKDIESILTASYEAENAFDENRLFLPKSLEDAFDDILMEIKGFAYLYMGSVPKNEAELQEWLGHYPSVSVDAKLKAVAAKYPRTLGSGAGASPSVRHAGSAHVAQSRSRRSGRSQEKWDQHAWNSRDRLKLIWLQTMFCYFKHSPGAIMKISRRDVRSGNDSARGNHAVLWTNVQGCTWGDSHSEPPRSGCIPPRTREADVSWNSGRIARLAARAQSRWGDWF